jgi:hypothetical protein
MLSQRVSAAPLEGYWFGEGYQPLWHAMSAFLDHETPDGSFSTEVRVYDGCTVTRVQFEGGRWMMLNANTERIVTTRINWSRAGPWIDDYRILELTDQHYRILHLASGVAYTAKRVDQYFKHPSCVPVS